MKRCTALRFGMVAFLARGQLVRSRHLLAAAAALAVLLAPRMASASVVVFNLNFEFSGAFEPEGTPPWLKAVFDDQDTPGSVLLTIMDVNLTDAEFVGQILFNLAPTLDPDDLSFAFVAATSTNAAFGIDGVDAGGETDINTGTNAFQADGDGDFDIQVDFANAPPADRFGVGDSASYLITGIASLTAFSFNFTDFGGSKNVDLLSAAHVQGVGPTDDNSGWVGAVPEPASMTLLASGLLGMFGYGWRRRNTKCALPA